MPAEDKGLSPQNYRPLNEEFYSSDPYDYFLTRWQQLVLFAAKPDELEKMWSEGITYGKLTVEFADSEVEDLDAHRASQHAYRVAESAILYQHTVETLLRLYLAHEGSPECPVLELSRLRWGFQSKIKDRFQGDLGLEDRRELLGPVLFGTNDPTDFAEKRMDADGFVRVRDAAEAALGVFAASLLDGANAYNAAKHGFAVRGGNASLVITNAAAGLTLESEGAALQYLEVKGQPKQWHRTSTWIDVEATLALTHIALYYMRALWGVARKRYLRAPEPVTLFFLDKHLYEVVEQKNRIHTFSMSLAYETDDE